MLEEFYDDIDECGCIIYGLGDVVYMTKSQTIVFLSDNNVKIELYCDYTLYCVLRGLEIELVVA